MRIILTLSFFVIISFSVSAQVGINTPDPDTNSILDLKSNNKGLLIPRLSTTDREAMSSVKFSQGMMVYDTTLNVLFVGYGNGASGNTKWYAMNPWKTEYRTDNNASTAHMTTMTAGSINHGNVGIGTASPTEKLPVDGKVKATEFIGRGAVPIGTIVMWSGSIAPTGWALCNGLITVKGYKTPNLKGRFVVGYDNSDANYNNPGNLSTKGTTTSDVGGSKSSSHTHLTDPPNIYSEYAGNHTHSGTTNGGGGSISMTRTCCGRHNVAQTNHAHSFTTNTGGNHRHLLKLPTTRSGAPSGASDNRPPYYTLAYIMRVE
jgi:microcystin-dependent protein